MTQTSDLLGPHVVQVGAFVPVSVDCTELLKGKTGLQYATITLRLKGSAGIVDTEPVWFNFYPDEAKGYEWGVGGPHDRSPGMLVQHPRVIPDDGLHR